MYFAELSNHIVDVPSTVTVLALHQQLVAVPIIARRCAVDFLFISHSVSVVRIRKALSVHISTNKLSTLSPLKGVAFVRRRVAKPNEQHNLAECLFFAVSRCIA